MEELLFGFSIEESVRLLLLRGEAKLKEEEAAKAALLDEAKNNKGDEID